MNLEKNILTMLLDDRQNCCTGQMTTKITPILLELIMRIVNIKQYYLNIIKEYSTSKENSY